MTLQELKRLAEEAKQSVPHWRDPRISPHYATNEEYDKAMEAVIAYRSAVGPSTLLSLIAEIGSKDAEIERLREALKPFADCAAFYDDAEYNEDHLTSNVSVGELFRGLMYQAQEARP